MLKANHSSWANAVFDIYINRLLRKSFHSFYLHGSAPEISDRPIILAPNHSTWWDGFFVYILNQLYLKKKFHIMILEEQLAKYRFFRRLGGFSIDQLSPKKMMESLQYTSRLLNDTRNLAVIFPQGELLPNHIRPIACRPGIGRILKMAEIEIDLIPLSIKTQHLGEQNAEVFFKFGSAHHYHKNLETELSDVITSNLDYIDKKIIDKDKGVQIFTGKGPVSQRSRDTFRQLGITKNEES